MITAGEAQATGAAIERLAQAVDDAHAAYNRARNALSWFGIEDQITRDAREAYEVKLGLYNAILAARKTLEVSPDYDHEMALMIVDTANRSVGLDTAAAIDAMASSNDPLSIAARAAVQTVQDAGAVMRIGVPVALIVLAGLWLMKE